METICLGAHTSQGDQKWLIVTAKFPFVHFPSLVVVEWECCFPVSSVHSGKSNICRKPWRHPSFLLLNPSSDSPILLQHTQEFGNSSIIWHYMMDLYNRVWTVMLHLLKQNRKCYISGILLSHSNQNTDSLGVFAPSFFIEPWDEITSDILITVS